MNHIAFIMDGNGRWAVNQNKTRSEGHLAGANTLREVAYMVFDKGIKVMSVYAFSTENFKRSEKEVKFLMSLFIKMFKSYQKEFHEKGIKVIFSGKKDPLPNSVWKAMKELEETTCNSKNGIINICLNYGGQDEIVDATKKICNYVKDGSVEIDDINKELFYSNLYQQLPPIDLVVRTSGEERISNFMLWQLSYAELYFTDAYWPDFKEEELNKAIGEYNKRNRRFGDAK